MKGHLRLATPADGQADPRFIAAVDAQAVELKARGAGFITCMFTEDDNMELLLGGYINPDACAGFMARCMAALANEAGE